MFICWFAKILQSYVQIYTPIQFIHINLNSIYDMTTTNINDTTTVREMLRFIRLKEKTISLRSALICNLQRM